MRKRYHSTNSSKSRLAKFLSMFKGQTRGSIRKITIPGQTAEQRQRAIDRAHTKRARRASRGSKLAAR